MSSSDGSDGYVELSEDWTDHGWFSFPRDFIRDRRLSWESRALGAWMASHDRKFVFAPAYIIRSGPAGRDKVRGMLSELESVGYLERVQLRKPNGQHDGLIYRLQPTTRVTEENPRSGRATANPSPVVQEENPRSGRATANPSPVLPSTANPHHKKIKEARESITTTDLVAAAVDGETGGAAAEFLNEVNQAYPRGRMGRRQLADLVPAVLDAWSEGWTRPELFEHLTNNASGARSAFGIVHYRLQPDQLPEVTRASTSGNAVPDVCGECDGREDDPVSGRVIWLDENHTQSELCPRCHPKAVAAQRVTDMARIQ